MIKMKNENENWGARIERGIIDEADGGRYRVKSLSRDGVKTPWIEPLQNEPTILAPETHDANGNTEQETIRMQYIPHEYKKGDKVYFFVFPDGRGSILGRFE